MTTIKQPRKLSKEERAVIKKALSRKYRKGDKEIVRQLTNNLARNLKRNGSITFCHNDPWTICVLNFSQTQVIGVAKRNLLDKPDRKIGETIALCRAVTSNTAVMKWEH